MYNLYNLSFSRGHDGGKSKGKFDALLSIIPLSLKQSTKKIQKQKNPKMDHIAMQYFSR